MSLDKQRHDRQGTAAVQAKTDLLIEKIRALPEERLNEVEDFVDFIRLREQQRALARDAAAASAAAFAAVWSNPEDDVYDALLTSAPSSSFHSHSLTKAHPRSGQLSLSAGSPTIPPVLT
jgi:hypothetical protein